MPLDYIPTVKFTRPEQLSFPAPFPVRQNMSKSGMSIE